MFPLNQISLFLLLTFILQVHCGGYWGKILEKEREVRKGNRVFKEVMEYCETRAPEGMETGLLLFKGSRVKFRNCFECECNGEGLTCRSSFGLLIFSHSSCKTVIDGCEPLLVDKYHNDLRCYSKIPLNQTLSENGYHEIKMGNTIFG